MTHTGFLTRRSEPLPAHLGAERRDAGQGAIVRRVLGEYEEMPGMSLTPAQARRLFALESDVCERVLAELLRVGALRCTHDGQYVLNRSAA